MRAYKLYGILALTSVLSACASPPASEAATKEQSTQPPQGAENVQALSAGKTVKVQTSQGEITVEPTVVAITDAQGKAGATGEPYYYDPWEGFNRTMFNVNHTIYSYVLLPAADGYRYIVPAVARDKIGNAFDNLREPLNLINNAVAGEFNEAGSNLGRFVINSTIGILGLFDPASEWFDIQPHKQTIADTMQRYHVGSGPYLVLPLLGPSDIRGAFSTTTEGFIHPINQISDPPESYQIRIFDGFDDFSNQSDTYRTLYENAQDPYIYFRNQYIQGQRRDELFNYDKQEQTQSDN